MTISENAPKMEINMAVNDMLVHLRGHTLDQLMLAICAYSLHNVEHLVEKEPITREKTKPTATKLERETLCFLYNNVERPLSLALQPGTKPDNSLRLIMDARNKLRTVMQKMGWTGQF